MLEARICRDCGTEVGANLLACPACGTLVHAEELKRLAAAAASAASPVEGLMRWREAYALLPAGSRQQQVIAAKIEELVPQAERAPRGSAPGSKSAWGKAAAGAGLAAVFLMKFKFIVVFVLTKGKLLLLGLTKMSTLLSMFVSFGVYWSVWGWKFAAGLILSIYIHEMGHVFMLTRFGIPSTAPMFIPGFGAVIRSHATFRTAREDARVGLAGPMWGLGAALAAWLLGLALHSPLCLAVAKVGAWINLFNMTPVWQLDGAHAFRALTRTHRWIAAGSVLAALFCTAGEVHGMLLLVLVFAAIRLFGKDTPETRDPQALAEYVFLIAAHSLLASLHVPT